VPDLSELKSCLDVKDEHITQALAAARSLSDPSPRDKALALLEHMVKIAAPNTGVPRVLVLFAQMARRDWIEGDLMVRLIGDSELTVIELLVDDGASRERIAGPLRVDVSLEEFRAAVAQNTAQLASLKPVENTERRLVLRGTRDHRALRRRPSISAFALDLGHVTGVKAVSKPDPPQHEPAPPPASAPPAAPEKPRRGPPPLPAQEKPAGARPLPPLPGRRKA
jgi:hypothetical protein